MSTGVHGEPAMDRTLVRIVVVGDVAPGKYKVGGVRVVEPTSDEEMGRELRTVEVRCGAEESHWLRRLVEGDDRMELA